MFDPLLGHVECVEFGKTTVKFRIAVDDGIFIYGDNFYLVVWRYIRKFHLFAVPLQLAVESLETGKSCCQHPHDNHLIEGAGEPEMG